MKLKKSKPLVKCLSSALMALSGLLPRADASEAVRAISLADLEDKIRGGWAGQAIGVAYGEPTEFRSLGKIIDWDIKWDPTEVARAINQDDLYTEMIFCAVMDKVGVEASAEELAAAFGRYPGPFWHANLVGRRNILRGITAPLSGHPAHNAHANDIDFQIESDFIGLMCPGLPQASNRFASRVGHIMNYGDGVYGGMFVAGMYSAAFFESSSTRKVVEAGLACIPADSRYAKTIADTLRWSSEPPDDWKEVWRQLQDKWARDDPCPSGALTPFNIDASLNGAYIALGLLYGGTDFGKVIEISTRCGQDSDCNPSNAGGIVGTMIGYDRIPDKWKRNIKDLGDRKFAFTEYSFEEIVQSTLERARNVVLKEGGRIERERAIIPVQQPTPAPLEQWDYGRPLKRVSVRAPDWTFKGEWGAGGKRRGARRSNTADDEAIFNFEGTGVEIVGMYVANGGLAEVYLDGEFQCTTDCFLDYARGEKDVRGGADVWHTFGLAKGKHVVRIVVRGQPFGDSSDSWIILSDAVVFEGFAK